ncbi:MAG: DUF1826 domain-containing protein [Burkholderiales bacterium]|nr:DUF1826 domain-containing protein [Burkholderiales bacterium]
MATEPVSNVLPIHFRYARSAAEFSVIRNPGVNLVIWRRNQDPALASVVDGFNAAEDCDVEAVLDVQEPDVWMFLDGCPASAARDMLAADIDFLVRGFGVVTGRRTVRAHLETVATDACRLFHVDAAGLRMLVTYSGFGTQWAGNGDVRRDQLTAQSRAFDAANRAIVPRQSDIRTARPWWVLLQKGESYPGNAGNGIVHRSPPVEGTGVRRLRLCLDEVS